MEALSDFILQQILRTDQDNCVLNLEDNMIEYKEQFNWSDKSNKQKCLKELAALSNAGGGYLIYGVNDKTGKVVGESATEDLANLADAFERQFSPVIKLSACTYLVSGTPVFVIYAAKYATIPTICIKEFEGVRNGTLLYRYGSKSEPIKGIDLISLFQHMKKDDGSEKLLKEQQKNRKNDLLPIFEWNSGGGGFDNAFKCNFINKGEEARVVEVVALKNINATINRACSSSRAIPHGERWNIFGNYKPAVIHPAMRTYAFRLYFTDKDENLYFSEFSGQNGSVAKTHVKPTETTQEELEQFKQEQLQQN